MTARILLVTGSRALEGSAYEAQAKATLRAIAGAFCPSVVVAGDARGPDAWAAEWVDEMHGAGLRLWSLDGWIYDEHRARSVEWAKGVAADERSGPRWPLCRNTRMVRAVAARARARKGVVQVLALEASWSATRGTAHTVGLANGAGLAVVHTVITSTRIQEGSDEG